MSQTPDITLTHWQRDPEREAEMKPLDFGLIRRLFTYTRPHGRTRNWLFAMVIIRSIQIPCLAWALGAVIKGPISNGDYPGTIRGILIFASLTVFTQFILHFRQRLSLQLGELVVHDLRAALFAKLMSLPLSYFHRTKLGRIISRMTSDIESVRAGVQNVFFVTLVGLGQMVFSSVVMLYYDWVLFLVVLGMAPGLWLLNLYFRRRFSEVTRATQESFSRVTATVAESVSGIRVTQGFVRQDVNAGLFRRLVADHSRYNMGVARTSGIFLPLLELKSQFFIAALLLIGGYRVFHGLMPVADLIQFFFLANVFFEPIQPLGNIYNQALIAMAGAERVFRLLDRQPDWTDAPTAQPLAIRGRVEFRDVVFGYHPAVPVLHGINFVAEPGQTIALVGHTGSGKSSIVNLTAKFYLPTRGQILIDGVDLTEIAGDSLHRQMGIVQQQNFLFTGTVMDNIRVGRPEAPDAEVIEAARRLDCLDLFDSLPGGLHTVVGERGSGLSLGQRQLVCFARAMVADPRIFILDEATSSIDTMTEVRIQRALAKLLRDRTSFVVAHRLSTIRNADQVLVLEQGRIIERGTHDQLVAARGTYARLYRQFVEATTA